MKKNVKTIEAIHGLVSRKSNCPAIVTRKVNFLIQCVSLIIPESKEFPTLDGLGIDFKQGRDLTAPWHKSIQWSNRYVKVLQVSFNGNCII